MAIVGVESLVYAVEDLKSSTRFFQDFGLPCVEHAENQARFVLAEGSHVLLLPRDDRRVPKTQIQGSGVHEIIWGVDSAEALEKLVSGLAVDCQISRDDDGTAHFISEFGIAMGLRVFTKKLVSNAPDPLNAPGHVRRLNQHRKWRLRAHPKVIAHVVFAVPHYEAAYVFMRDRLHFRLSDSQHGFGKYLRADGSTNHHNILLLNADAPLPDMDGKLRFHHANFGVEDIDEMMVGANYMVRKGWPPSHFGLGRHRIDSALFYYIPCPAGGEAEYGADSDCIDDSWVPRDWVEPLFAYAHFVHNLPPFLVEAPSWRFNYITEGEAPLDEERRP